LRKFAEEIGLHDGFSAHSMRATFITRAIGNGASLVEQGQHLNGHATRVSRMSRTFETGDDI